MDMWREDGNKQHDSQTPNVEKIISESEECTFFQLTN